MVDLGRLDAMVKRPQCDLCSLIVLGCQQTWRGDWAHALIETDTTCFINALDVSRQQPRGYALQITESHTNRPFQWVEFEIVLKPKLEARPVDRSFEVCPTVDFNLAKKLFRNCEDNHPNCKVKTKTSIPNGMSVIDVESMNIVLIPQDCRYCALSYVWGKSFEPWLTLTRENASSLGAKHSLRNAHLPRTIRDAIMVTSELGERYLWVDSLCIVQDDPVNQKDQIDRMDTIYAASIVALVAATGDSSDSGLPGVSTWLRNVQRQIITIQDIEVSNVLPRLKDTANLSVWNTRAWTYQERMFSSRCLLFTESQMYYACSEPVQYERKDRLLPTMWSTERFQPISSSKSLMEAFSKNVTDYTQRSLTAQADILRAFQGVINEMSRNYDTIFYFGLPVKNFEDSLLWQPSGHTIRRTGVGLPSWSWASIIGAMKYTFTEERICSETTIPIPGFWKPGEEPSYFPIHWSLNVDGSALLSINPVPQSTMSTVSDENSSSFQDHPPSEKINLTLQNPGRLLFTTQYASFYLENGVPYTWRDTWWTDYVEDVDLSRRSMITIRLPGNRTDNIAGFIEMDKNWATETLTPENANVSWDFLAISLATSKSDDFMHYHLTMQRNLNYPLVYSRNVRQLLVNVMMIEWTRGVARRLGVGKIFLDMWEFAKPQLKWIVLE